MAMTDKFLTLREAHEFLLLNGVEGSYGWLKMQVTLGKIRSEKILNSRAVERTELERIIRDRAA